MLRLIPWFCCLGLLMLMPGCATNPVTKKSDFVLMSEDQELALGQKAAAEVAKQLPLLPEDDPLVRYVDSVGQRIASVSDRPELFYRFHVVDDATLNAFALPGGYIYVHRGLINHLNSEAELAAVLGHEIGHVTARHAVKQYTQLQAYQLGAAVASIFVPIPYGITTITDMLAIAMVRGFGREAELQSDELSLKYIAKAGYDPQATIGILRMLKRMEDLDALIRKDAGDKVERYHGAFSTHPETEKRIREAAAKASALLSGWGVTKRMTFLRHLEGYPYGDSPEQGAVVNQRFIHPKLEFQLRFPDRWAIQNTPASLNARVRKQKAYFQLTLKELVKRRRADEILAQMFRHKRMTSIERGRQDVFEYAHAAVDTSAPHVSHAHVEAWVFLKGPKAFIMLMWCERNHVSEYQKDFSDIAASFRSYIRERDGDVPRITLVRWQQGDSWHKLARRCHDKLGRFTAQKLAALNGMGLKETPAPGTWIKTVH